MTHRDDFPLEGWDHVLSTAQREGYGIEALGGAGLVLPRQTGTGHYDRFRGRLLFPIADSQGRVIAFGGRALAPGEEPKYLNSPETPLYSKGQVLFNLDKARQAIRQQNFALLVEGQMDCISVFGAGVTPVLATSGTAFTEQQARLLRRYTTRVVVNFDPDTAGANAAEKSIALLTLAISTTFPFLSTATPRPMSAMGPPKRLLQT